MAPITEGLEPKTLWKHFEDITKIPRPSKHEERILKFLKNFADERNLETREDDTGNIVIVRPGSACAVERVEEIVARNCISPCRPFACAEPIATRASCVACCLRAGEPLHTARNQTK